MDNVVLLIPAYNPSQKLIKLVKDLGNDFKKIIIVNDGSTNRASEKIFLELESNEICDVIGYSQNRGKGGALKYGINYYLENYKNEYKGIVTADADYQHSVSDIINVSLRLIGNQDSIILGVRDFNSKNVPRSNRFGNKITSFIFKLLYGVKISDTQTGLRGIPNRYLNLSLEISGQRFEYEMSMLIKLVKEKIFIIQVPITTIYYKRSESKFIKTLDPIIIYKVLFTEYIKFTLSSLFSSVIDLVIFTLFISVFTNINNNIKIILGTFFARIVSGFINFNINKNLVFNSHERSDKILCKFYFYTFGTMLTSALCVMLLHNIFPNVLETLLKIIVDVAIYFVGYRIQKKYIYKT